MITDKYKVKVFSLTLLILSSIFLTSCTAANVNVLGLLSQMINPPGFSTGTTTGTVSGSGITIVGSVSAMQTTTLSGGGITVSQGVVK